MKILASLLVVTSACTTNGIYVIPEPQGSDAGLGSDAGSGTTATTALANCAKPEGPLHTYALASEFSTLATGQWVRCSGNAILANEELGIEFDANGAYYVLGDDGHGGVVKRTGFGKQGTWDGSQEGAHSVQWNIHPEPNSGTGGYATFEDGPRRFAMLVEYNQEDSIYAIVN